MPYRTIVVGTDGSPTATVAVEGAEAHETAPRTSGPRGSARCIRRVTPASADGSEAAEGARAKKVDATAELIEGTPGESILAAAIKHDAD